MSKFLRMLFLIEKNERVIFHTPVTLNGLRRF